jgi:predicted AAA+ superfamily ATPase
MDVKTLTLTLISMGLKKEAKANRGRDIYVFFDEVRFLNFIHLSITYYIHCGEKVLIFCFPSALQHGIIIPEKN